MHLTGMHLIDIHLTGMSLMGMHFIGMYLTDVCLMSVYHIKYASISVQSLHTWGKDKPLGPQEC
jgi:hypothetical protein